MAINIQNGFKIYQMDIKMPTSSIARTFKIYPNLDFWFEKIPSGNPGEKRACPTFNADDVLPDLLGQQRIRHELDQVVDGVDRRVDGLEPLDLVADGHRRRMLRKGTKIIESSRSFFVLHTGISETVRPFPAF
jgi:hypothetical protein